MGEVTTAQVKCRSIVVYFIATIIPIAFAATLTYIILETNKEHNGNPVFYTYSSVYLFGLVSYSLIMVLLIKKLNKLDKDGHMEE